MVHRPFATAVKSRTIAGEKGMDLKKRQGLKRRISPGDEIDSKNIFFIFFNS